MINNLLKLILITIILSMAFYGSLSLINNVRPKNKDGISVSVTPKPKPLEKYAFENLKNTNIAQGNIELSQKLIDTEKYTGYLFNFAFNPAFNEEKKTTTGQLNLPNGNGSYPVIIMFRGYINQETYKTGDGTQNASKFFAENGFITVAPDFLGYGNSDTEAGNIFETRFQTYVTAISLLKSINEIPNWDGKNIFIWGHSNGGQIALTALEIGKFDYPTVLWAPVSKPFPYSILYYTDESDDGGKLIRRELAKFEKDYDSENYSLTNYLNYINAPLQIHQGTADDAVPLAWSNLLVAKLNNLDKDVSYYTHPGADHNMRPVWNDIVKQDLQFYRNHLEE